MSVSIGFSKMYGSIIPAFMQANAVPSLVFPLKAINFVREHGRTSLYLCVTHNPKNFEGDKMHDVNCNSRANNLNSNLK